MTDTDLLTTAPDPLFEVVTHTRDGAVWVDLRGELDLAGHERLRETLAVVELGGVRRVHVLMSHLRFCDVRGLGVVASFAAKLRRRGVVVTTRGANGTIRKVAGVLAVSPVLTFEG